MGFLIPPRPLTKFEIHEYYKNEPRFNGVFSRNNLPKKIKDGACIVNLHEYAAIVTHWILYFVTEMKLFILIFLVLTIFLKKLKDLLIVLCPLLCKIKANIFRVQENDSIMCGYFCIGCIDFMAAGKKLTHYTNSFSPYDLRKNDQIVLSYFKYE